MPSSRVRHFTLSPPIEMFIKRDAQVGLYLLVYRANDETREKQSHRAPEHPVRSMQVVSQGTEVYIKHLGREDR